LQLLAAEVEHLLTQSVWSTDEFCFFPKLLFFNTTYAV